MTQRDDFKKKIDVAPLLFVYKTPAHGPILLKLTQCQNLTEKMENNHKNNRKMLPTLPTNTICLTPYTRTYSFKTALIHIFRSSNSLCVYVLWMLISHRMPSASYLHIFINNIYLKRTKNCAKCATLRNWKWKSLHSCHWIDFCALRHCQSSHMWFYVTICRHNHNRYHLHGFRICGCWLNIIQKTSFIKRV